MSGRQKGYVPKAPKGPLRVLAVFLRCAGGSIERFFGCESDEVREVKVGKFVAANDRGHVTLRVVHVIHPH